MGRGPYRTVAVVTEIVVTAAANLRGRGRESGAKLYATGRAHPEAGVYGRRLEAACRGEATATRTDAARATAVSTR
jgi:hypothetical protein